MEEMFKYDLRLNYILSQNTPSYKTICEFINDVIKPNALKLFSSITTTIIKEFNIDISDQYLDGTKIEANANKYKFVYKKRKYWDSLNKKIVSLLIEFGSAYKEEKDYIPSARFKKEIDRYVLKEGININDIPCGKGYRPTRAQKLYKYSYKLLSRLVQYEEIERICGPDRNSYYKSDKDATAMALKSDYYSGHGSNMKAAYNVQLIVSSGFVLMYGLFQNRTDYRTLIPMLERYYSSYHDYPKNLCADSGYGIFDNHYYLDTHGINNYVKFLNWNSERNGKSPRMFYLNDEHSSFTCLNGKTGKVIDFGYVHQRKKNSKLYRFEGCLDCPLENKCRHKIKDRTIDYRTYELSIEEEIYHETVRENLLSDKGIEIRVNRSIQVEGTFGDLKQNLGYIRLRRRGLEQVSAEIMLMCLAINIRKLFSHYKEPNIRSKCWIYNKINEV